MAHKETRSERQRFLQRLEGLSSEDRQRIQKEHVAYMNGERATDANFGESETAALSAVRSSQRAPRSTPRPPMGKDLAYLKAQKRLISEQRSAVAAKTVAGSGRKAPVARKSKDDDEDYIPAEDDVDEDIESDVMVEATAPKKKVASKKKPAPVNKRKPVAASKQLKKTRKPSAAMLAKEKAKAEKNAAARKRCQAAVAAEVEGASARSVEKNI
ncbi:hypothetical protein F444_21998 [Phytophthora nicotianae P1976]|uniref:Uncharacterized protein n=1 Tax=Phytophthora nicotianae P1976 TaxID=1317066 RepID=A0A080YZ85_PHYNI|nr:hypothetical protein F444_21998 [Phytophthora nicotianae P1976]